MFKCVKSDSLIYCISELKYSKIAAFDLDHTLIRPKSGNVHPKDENDWQWLYPNTKKILEHLYKNRYTICIFSNQTEKKIDNTLLKITSMAKDINVPLNFFFSIKNDIYRKPRTGMWKKLRELVTYKINIHESFFCGDAAGRYINGKKDFANTDYQFAKNNKLIFKVPEQVFLNEHVNLEPLSNQVIYNYTEDTCDLDFLKKFSGKIAIMNVGRPASGKSSITKILANHNYIIVSNDEKNAKSVFASALKNNHNIVIDNTNATKKQRSVYLEPLIKNNYTVICFWFDIPVQVSQFLNNYRIEKGGKPISEIVYRVYAKHFEQPVKDEGFSLVHRFTKIPCIPANLGIYDYYF
jgi:bifunctional polynucleotide phosphatase/kinase